MNVPREVEREDIVQHELPLEAREVDDRFKRLGGVEARWMPAPAPPAPVAEEDSWAFLSRYVLMAFAPSAGLEDAEESAGNAAGT